MGLALASCQTLLELGDTLRGHLARRHTHLQRVVLPGGHVHLRSALAKLPDRLLVLRESRRGRVETLRALPFLVCEDGFTSLLPASPQLVAVDNTFEPQDFELEDTLAVYLVDPGAPHLLFVVMHRV